MADNASSPAAGGFLPQSLPSPAPTASTVSTRPAGLPHPRSRALRPGSAKEDQVRNFISDRMAHITRRFVKKVGAASLGDKVDGQMMDDEEVEGYNSLDELCKDLNEVIRIVWLSGTRRSTLVAPVIWRGEIGCLLQQRTYKYPLSSTSPASSTPG